MITEMPDLFHVIRISIICILEWMIAFKLYGRHFIRKKKIIHGCESRGTAKVAYMTRYTLLEHPKLQICLHVFHRSDADDLHDHPWNFVTIPLWRGYKEDTVCPKCNGAGFTGYVSWKTGSTIQKRWCWYKDCRHSGKISQRIYPFIPYFRKATHQHRVILIDEKPAVTLMFMGAYVRDWGFWVNRKWVYWKDYFENNWC